MHAALKPLLPERSRYANDLSSLAEQSSVPDDVVVCGVPGAEDALFAEAVRLFGPRGTTRVHRFFGDVVTNALAGLHPLFGPLPPVAVDWSRHTMYAIIGTGRSGSTYLCDLLASTGVCGNPTEHVRDPFVQAVRHGMIDADEVLTRGVAAGATPNGVFGTKIVSRFFLALLEHFAEQGVTIEQARQRFSALKVIHHDREDKVAQAASIVRAKKTGRWQVRGDAAKPRAPAFELSPEEVAAGIEEYEHNLERQRRLDAAVADLFDESQILRTSYEDLVRDPCAVVSSVCRHLGVQLPDGVVPHSRYQKIPTTDRIYEQLRTAIDARDARRGAVDRVSPARTRAAQPSL